MNIGGELSQTSIKNLADERLRVMPKASNIIWNSKLVDQAAEMVEDGQILTKVMSPFFFGDPSKRAAGIQFEYTPEEQEEWLKCASDIIHFASNYCYAMTDDGIQKIELRDYQVEILQHFQNNRFNILLCGRQMGKTITSAIFLCWYSCFNVDKNVIIVADKGETSEEIIDKLKIVMFNLPFFLQPGVKAETATSLNLDNGVRIKAKTTTKRSGLGSTCHLLFADEFAYVEDNISEHFYKSIFPTLSSSAISRMIITSTPNGHNKFWELWEAAVARRNSFNPIYIEWHRAPGRNEEWKKMMIENLGSEAIFDQEYACKFIVNSNLLLNQSSLELMNKIKVPYVYRNLTEYSEYDLDFNDIKFHPDFKIKRLYDERQRYVVTLDAADGVGRDYSVAHIFEYGMLSRLQIKNKKIFNREYDFFCLRQVGIFRSNTKPIEEFAKILSVFIFDVIGPTRCHIAFEHNFKGDYIFSLFENNENFFSDMVLHTKHNIDSVNLKPGVSMKHGNRREFLQQLKRHIHEKRIQLNELETVEEFNKFGKTNKSDRYEGISSTDDSVMSSVLLVPYMSSEYFETFVDDIIDYQNEIQLNAMRKRMFGSAEDIAERKKFENLYEIIGSYL